MITYRLQVLVLSALAFLILLYLLTGFGHVRAIHDPRRPYRGGPVGLALLLFAWGERM